MTRFCAIIAAMVSTALAETAPSPLNEALEKKQVSAEFAGNGRDSATLKLANLTDTKISIELPAGSVLAGENGERQLVLRALRTELTPKAEADAILPTAALSSKNTSTQRPLRIAMPSAPEVAKLVEFFDKQADLPRPTAQLAVFIALEDMPWPGWKKWMEPVWSLEKPAKPHPTPAEVAQAVDAIAFVKLAWPEKKPAILNEPDFKRLALRNPWARGKAMVLYGITVEDAITGEPSLPPDLGKLLHTAPNDNCAICRQRSKTPEFP